MLPLMVMTRRAGGKDRGNGAEGWCEDAPGPSLDPYAGTRAATQVSSSALAGSGTAGSALGSISCYALSQLSRISPAPRQAVRWWTLGGGRDARAIYRIW